MGLEKEVICVEKYFAGRKRAFRSKPWEVKKRKKNWISDGTKKSRDLSVRKIEELIPVGCGTIDDYERLHRITNGSYGAVYKARHTKTGEIVAVKKQFDGLCQSTVAEINILSALDHPSVVGYKEVAVDDRGGVYVVMEYAQHDLNDYIHKTQHPFALARVKCLMKQLLEGVEYLHERCRVMHRDLKPANILLDALGKLKICDFGMSRQIQTASDPPTTTSVGTLWYRAPELLLGESMYSAAIDMWSVGCIMAELFLREELFACWSEIQQLRTITQTLEQPRQCLHHKFDEATTLRGAPVLTDVGFDLLCHLLAFNPDERITARDALNHHWFKE